MEKKAAIGVFDSGVGGLTVVREIMKTLPDEKIIYFGDTARVPYGSKSKETVTKYTEQIIRFLLTHEVKALVVACNTMSALALDTVENNLSIPITGVVRPGALAACRSTRNKRIGVIATESTIKSRLYKHLLREIDPETEVIGKACPLFVPLVEEGMIDDPVTEEIARRYLFGLIRQDIDTLILGCTHYPLLKDTIAEIVGENVVLVNPAYETARGLKELLSRNDMLNDGEALEHEFYVSDSEDKFARFAASLLHIENLTAQIVNIEEY
ncbi:MAG: glutamate racemase [Lachnospiraceae bacterium]|nr:glutamate racemase [Lachnospiraceae bacterium]